MRWSRRERSSNLEDRRFQTGGRVRGRSIGLGGLLILLALSFLFKENFFALLSPGMDIDVSPMPGESTSVGETSPEEEELVDFMSFVLDDTQSTWSEILPGGYREAQMVLFRDAARSACGFAQAATGPFYCPGDEKVYLDLGFFDELRRRFGAPGDFAQAYVIAHELGHHVQTLLGIEAQVRQAQQSRRSQANALSVSMELQADCFAGIWGHSAAERGILEPGDVEEGLNATAAIGDDRIQKMSGSAVAPESFTHGSSAQRVTWFRRGLNSGNPEDCDTFSAQ